MHTPRTRPTVVRAVLPTLLLAAACGDDPVAPAAPTACGSIPSVTIHVGETSNATACFNDVNGDVLTYSATSSNSSVATATVAGTAVTVTAVAPGNATVTVTATDPGGLSGQQSFAVAVPNRAPQPRGTPSAVTVEVGAVTTIEASQYFSEPDGETLFYTVTVSDAAVASTSVSGSMVTVTALAKGSATVTITASDPGGLSADQSFQMTVPNRPPAAVGTASAQTIEVGQSLTVDFAALFTDPDGDPLTLSAATSIAAVAGASVSGSTVTVTGVGRGTTTITVTARDPEGLSATQQMQVNVLNRSPVAVGSIPAQSIDVGARATVNASPYFSDPDGDALTYSATSSNSGVATVSASGSDVVIQGVRAGSATITVAASDPEGLSATQQIQVTVLNRAPRPVGSVPAQTIEVGRSTTVNASQYFSDPDGDALTYSAASSDSGVVSASVSGSTVTITAAGVGSATITVTARDPAGLSATQQVRVTVTQPNRPPRPAGSIPAQTVDVGRSTTVNASQYFTDPDGDALTYSATSSNSGVASASVSGSTVTITGVSAGSATITVTARDPGGLTGTQQFGTSVLGGGGGAAVRDDFDSSASLGDWEVRNADAAVSNGTLRLTRTTSTHVGIAERRLESSLADWTIRARVGSEADGQLVGVWWVTGNADYPVLAFTLGTIQSYNYTTWVFDAGRSSWRAFSDLRGHSSAVRTGAGEFTSIAVGFEDRTLIVSAGNTQLINLTLSATNTFLPAFRSVESIWLVNEGASSSASLNGQVVGIAERMGPLDAPASSPFDGTFGTVDGIPLKSTGARNSTSLFDWVEVTGETSGGGSNRSPETVGTIPAMTVTAGSSKNVNASSYFRDPDGDALTYTASSSRTSVATVRVSGRTVTVAGVAEGTATIRVTATDPGGLSAVQTFGVTVEAGGGSAPDLVVVSPAVDDDTPDPGASFTLSATVRNRGDGQSASTTLRYYRSSNATISSQDTEVGTDAVRALGAGAASDETITLTAPSQEGTYYYGACVDAVSGESATNNNCSDGVEVEVSGGGGGRDGECVKGATYARGESCDVYGTGSSSKTVFTVLSDGRARFGFITAGNRIVVTGSLNGVKYHFVASHQGGGVWKVDEYTP